MILNLSFVFDARLNITPFMCTILLLNKIVVLCYQMFLVFAMPLFISGF